MGRSTRRRAGAVLRLAAVIGALTAGVGQATTFQSSRSNERLRAPLEYSRQKASTENHRKLPRDYAAWTHVSVCESGGWQVLGSPSGPYPDALGIDRQNWIAAGGKPEPHGPVTLKRRVYEIKIADRFIRQWHMSIPDQGYCSAW